MRTNTLLFWLGLLGAGVGADARAQSAVPRTRVMVGLMLAGYASDHPNGGILGRGLLLGIERHLDRRVAVRGVGSLMNSWPLGDDVSRCPIMPNGECWPDPHFAHRLWGLEALVLVRPVTVPLRLVLGPGALWPVGAREGERNRRSIDTTLGGPRATLRAGFELTLGRSAHAPLLHWSRTIVSSDVLSMTHISTLGLVFRIH